MLYGVYRAVGTGLFCLGYPPLLAFSRLLPGPGGKILQRTGRNLPARTESRSNPPRIWFHAASVGEVAGVEKLISALAANGDKYEYILTTMTVHGLEVAVGMLGPEVSCYLAPLDVLPVVRRYIRRIQPDIYVCLETELWPVLLGALHEAGVKSVLLNGRMTGRSYQRYLLVRELMSRTLAVFASIAVIGEPDRERFAGLGAADGRIEVTGNSKYDYPPQDIETVRSYYRTLLAVEDRTVIISGSTRRGEEEVLAEVYRDLSACLAGRVLWIVAPRHLDRLAEIERLLHKRGLEFDRYTELKKTHRPRVRDIVLVDCLGELALLYSAGDHLFVGGSLAAKGGHNIMEAARWGRPVYYGPNIEDYSDAAEILEREGGGFRVADGRDLTERILFLLRNQDACRQACSGALRAAALQRGAGSRQVKIVKELLQDSTG